MFARMARYEVSPDRLDDAVTGFREASAGLADLGGAQGGYLLVDRESGATLTLTLWENYDAMCASEVQAAGLRRRALSNTEGTIVAVEQFEVAVEFGAVGSASS